MKQGFFAIVTLLLAACASGPHFPVNDVNTELRPAGASQASVVGQRVLWSGMIIANHAQQDHTQLEVLAYPFDFQQKPDTDARTQGRFLANHKGLLDPAEYAPGRLITLKGRIAGSLEGKIEEMAYTYPLVEVSDIYLWPQEEPLPRDPQLHFGIGVIFH